MTDLTNDARDALHEGIRRATGAERITDADRMAEIINAVLDERGFVIETKRDARRNIEAIRRELVDMMEYGCPHMSLALTDMNLVSEDAVVGHDVRMPKETLQQFRNHYSFLIAFAAVVCKVKPSTLSMFDMGQALWGDVQPAANFEEILEACSILELGGAKIAKES